MSCIHEVKKKKTCFRRSVIAVRNIYEIKDIYETLLTVSPVTTLCSNSKHFCNC